MRYNAIIVGSFLENMSKAIDMFINMSEYTSAKRWYQLLSVIVMVGIVCLTLLGVAGDSPKAYADGIPGGNVSDPDAHALDNAKPAVVLILTLLSDQLTDDLASTATRHVSVHQVQHVYRH